MKIPLTKNRITAVIMLMTAYASLGFWLGQSIQFQNVFDLMPYPLLGQLTLICFAALMGFALTFKIFAGQYHPQLQLEVMLGPGIGHYQSTVTWLLISLFTLIAAPASLIIKSMSDPWLGMLNTVLVINLVTVIIKAIPGTEPLSGWLSYPIKAVIFQSDFQQRLVMGVLMTIMITITLITQPPQIVLAIFACTISTLNVWALINSRH